MAKKEVEILTKKKGKTDKKFGKEPKDRTVEELLDYGIVNIDKPAGPTSHQIAAHVRDILHLKKAGHSGTLDPNVTGVLPTALGKATKIIQVLLKGGKEYVGVMHLHKEVELKELRKVFKKFLGKIKQLPPVRSAVKRQERIRTIYTFEIMEKDGKEVLFRTACQAGTYIRKLIHDVGQELGCGAHMAELRRTRAGPLKEDTLVRLQDLKDAYWYYKEKGNSKYIKSLIQPIENAVELLPKVWVFDSAINSLTHGANLKIPGISKYTSNIKKEELVAIMSLKNELIGLGTAKMNSFDIKKSDKGVVVTTHKILMEPGVYPKIEKEWKFFINSEKFAVFYKKELLSGNLI